MKIIKSLLKVSGFWAIWQFFDDDSGKIVSKRGEQILSDPELMDEVMRQYERQRHKPPIIIDIN